MLHCDVRQCSCLARSTTEASHSLCSLPCCGPAALPCVCHLLSVACGHACTGHHQGMPARMCMAQLQQSILSPKDGRRIMLPQRHEL
jgi:hypothetical protein